MHSTLERQRPVNDRAESAHRPLVGSLGFLPASGTGARLNTLADGPARNATAIYVPKHAATDIGGMRQAQTQALLPPEYGELSRPLETPRDHLPVWFSGDAPGP